MTSSVQRRRWISRRGLRYASGAMALAILLLLGAVTIPSAQAQTFTVFYSFTGEGGSFPQAGLVRDAAGNLYSTTANSGPNPPSYGTVFKVRKTGKEKVLYNFTGGTDGGYPYADLVRDTAGNLYGTTTEGGAISDSCNWSGSGCGTVFKVDANGVETVLYSFTGGTMDGCNPYGGLLRDKVGNFYGTTSNCGASGYGTVFELDTSGVETVLHNFSGGSSDGAYPTRASLVPDEEGNLYGTAYGGGSSNAGVVYGLSKSGALSVLHSFAGGTTDGCNPFGTPFMDAKGNLYGTTESCGSSNKGIVWKLSKKGAETVLHNFASGSSDGAYPYEGVIRDAKGNLYGNTIMGGSTGYGTIFKLSKSGTLTVLHRFDEADGAFPAGRLVRDAARSLYGTTQYGGDSSCNASGSPYGCGTVWMLTP
jgi:uncharacterized repeat protein (TIGR03803 family)